MSQAPRTPADVLKEARAKDSREKRGKVLAVVDKMAASGEPITFAAVAEAAGVSKWLVYAEGVREQIDDARRKQAGAQRRQAKAGATASAASLATDLELARVEIRKLREERDRLKSAMRRKLGDELDQTANADLVARINELVEQNRLVSEELAEFRQSAKQQARRIAELEDDLAASRTAHRDLMRELNRSAS
ncbi:DUF6262 family protein [Streptomyces yangpuensis]|uniref:DUF6262 family protein n=1 Tax=Streptomyces yangpuensis TaxID=1648182 RepID=UPI0036656025